MWRESYLCFVMFQKRKRKEKEDDTVSLSSFDLKVSAMPAPWLAEASCSTLEHVLAPNLILLRDSGCLFCELSVIPLTLRSHNFLSGGNNLASNR